MAGGLQARLQIGKTLNGWVQAVWECDPDTLAIDSPSWRAFTGQTNEALMHYGWLDPKEVVAWLKANKPPMLHLIITGRSAPAELIEYADLVTEMTEIKHPFTAGIRAQQGIEF